MAELANCRRCGVVFAKVTVDICPRCKRIVEDEYDRCSKYLRNPQNRGCTINELSEATEVSVAQITEFIREGRLSTNRTPNLGYACESCGTIIQSGHLCEACAGKMKKELTLHEELQKRLREDQAEQDQAKDFGGYYELRSRIHRDDD